MYDKIYTALFRVITSEVCKMGKDLNGRNLGIGLCQKKNGYYSARFVNREGERVEKVFKNKNEAKQWLVDAKYMDAHGNVLRGDNPTVDAWFEYWHENILKGSYNTKRQYSERYKYRIGPVIGKMQIKSVLMLHCQNVINQAQDKGDASSSLAKIKSVMSMLFESAVENRLIEQNPVTKHVKYNHTKPAEKYVLTVKQQHDFCELAKESVHGKVFLLALQTGMRCGELMALSWSDINWAQQVINVSRTMYFNEIIGEFEEKTTKTEKGEREIPLTNTAMQILIEQKRARDNRSLVSMKHGNHVFLNKDGNPTKPQVYNRSLTALSKKLNIPNITMHCLRHTFATRCIEAGMKPKVLQEILGHADIAMTMNLYVHVTGDEKKNEMEKLANYIG